jgi:hypothetical protein
MPVTPAPPVDLPANPIDGPSAQAAVDAVVAERARRQAGQTQEFFDMVAGGLDNADAARLRESETNWTLLLTAGVVVLFFLI